MFNISPTLISTIYFWSKIILFIGAGATFFGTIGTIWSGSKLESISNVRISKNEKETAVAKAEAARANERTAELRKEAVETSLQLEKEKIKRLELEDAVSPRMMEQLDSSNALKPYKAVNAIISHIHDIEAQRTAGQIAMTLKMAGFKIEFVPYNPNDIYPDGVVVERNVGVLPEDDISGQAADELVKQLIVNKIESRTFPARELPKNTIFIKVGVKPYKYFSDKKIEEIQNKQRTNR